MSYIHDDRGNKSSLRLIVLVLFGLLSAMIVIWTMVFFMEAITKEVPDYEGLALIITAILGGGIFSLAAKVIQKKYESKNDKDENDSIE
jgi:RsiW-degrading membrane proteinase PrsW (M82 family)